MLDKVLRSRRFWLAVLALATTLVKVYVPEFPTEVWLSVQALLLTVIAALTVDDAADKVQVSLRESAAVTERALSARSQIAAPAPTPATPVAPVAPVAPPPPTAAGKARPWAASARPQAKE